MSLGLWLSACHPDEKDDSAAPPDDSGTTPTDAPPFVETLDPDVVHVLASSSPALGDPGHPLAELAVTLDTRWSLDFEDADGSGGAVRIADGDTVYVRSALPPDFKSELERVDATGTLLWSQDAFFMGDFSFAHGLVQTPAGDYLIADTILARILAVSEEGEVQWELSFVEDGTTRLPNGIDLATDGDGVTRIVVSSLYRTGPDAADHVDGFRLGGRTDVPTREWTFAGGQGTSERLWPHGPRFLDDGSVSVNYAARGQIARLVDGEVDWVVPRVPGKLAFPRDMVVLPDETWLVADAAAEVLRVYDPLGRFEIVDAAFVPGVFGLVEVPCGAGGTLPCLGG